MKVTEHIEHLLRQGRSPRELVELGFPKSVVTRVRRRLKRGKGAPRRKVPKGTAKAKGRFQPTGMSAATTALTQPEAPYAGGDPVKANDVVALLPEVAAFIALIRKLGADKRADCPYHEDDLCTRESWVSRGDIPEGVGELVLVDTEKPRWRVKPSPLYCSICTGDLDYRLFELEYRVDTDPLSGVRGEFKCECGAQGNIAVALKCTKCGRQTWWGWFPSQ